MTTAARIPTAVFRLRIAIVLIFSFWTRQSHTRYPETLLYRALSSNHSTPTDLIFEIQKWILRPSEMTTNQLIECRDSAQNIWRHQCNDRMQLLLSTAKDAPGIGFVFTPSTHLFALELQDEGKSRNSTGSSFAMGWRKWTSSNHIQIAFDISARTRDGRFYAETRSIYFTGSRIYFSVFNQSVSLFGYLIDTVKIRWYPVRYTVTDIVIERGMYRC